jgi:CRP-like cAMP-binding protein
MQALPARLKQASALYRCHANFAAYTPTSEQQCILDKNRQNATMSRATATFKEGQIIFNEGDAPGAAYLIESGRVEVSINQNGQRLVLSYLGPGDLLGEMAA